MTTFNDSRISLTNDEEIGPQIDIIQPQIVEIKYNGYTLWINVDEVCRLRITKVKEGVIFDAPSIGIEDFRAGFTQREAEG